MGCASEFYNDISHPQNRQWPSRVFGLIWIINLTPVLFALIDRSQRDFDLWTSLGWIGLFAFVALYVSLILFIRPHWIPRSRHDLQFSRVATLAMASIVTGFTLAWPDKGFEYFIIYPAIISGVFFSRREAGRWLPFLASLFISLTFQHGNYGDMAQGLLLIIGLGFNMIFWTALLQQNRELRRARAEIARLAVADERLRIARDLHDLLGHSLSLIALKSELAGRLLPDFPQRAAGEVHDIEQVARTSLQEVREAVSGYRTASLADEIASAEQILDAAGIDMNQTIQIPEMSPPIDRILGWFVREGITNVIRHAAATQVRLSLLEHRRTITAEIEDNGHGATGNASSPRGNGLKGLRERIESLGGTLATDGVPAGGFWLRATIPKDTAANGMIEPDPASPPAAIEEQEPVAAV